MRPLHAGAGIAAISVGMGVLWCSSRAVEFSPRLTVLPREAKVFAGHNLQFDAAVVGESQPYSVHWSVVGPGGIDGDGLYHAAQVAATAEVVATAGNGVADSVAVQTVPPPKHFQAQLLSTCYEDGTVNVYSPKTLSLLGAFTVGGRAAGIALEPTGRRAALAVESQIVAVNLQDMSWHPSLPIAGARLSEVAWLNRTLVVATDNDASASHPGVRIYRVNGASTPVLVASALAGETPEGIAVDDGGRTFYVSNINGNSIMRYRLDSQGRPERTGAAQTAARPFGLAIDPVHHVLFVADNDTTVVSGSRARPGLERFSLPSLRRIGGIVSTGSVSSLPLGVAVDPASSRLFVTNEGDGNVAVFSLPRLKVMARLPAGLTPWLPTLDADAHRLYVPNARANTISIYDTRTLQPVKPWLTTCSYPTAVAVSPARAR